MEPSSNNLFGADENLENTTSGPMITGLPEDQFTPPQPNQYPPTTEYYGDTSNPQVPEAQPVDPFVPPKYESVAVEPDETPQNNDAEIANPQMANPDLEIANWQAQNIMTGDKNKLWYLVFAGVLVVLLAVSWLIQSWTFALLIIVSAVAILVVLSSNNVRQISYSLSGRGFYIDGNLHEYADFRSFGVLQESNVFSIVFLPKKRFAPSVSIYFPEANGEQIVDILGSILPMEEIKLDFIDRIVRKLKL
ncbi:MAG: hypothetical protein KIG14_01395 [Candidatus Sacchiramonaceae bacterium]|nr:hypothetical protein [Candidatus Saccharimonadaceae bacterium]